MSFLDNLIERFIRINRKMKRWKRMVSVLSAVIVFITTYALILPAITLDKDTAQQQPGIEVAASEGNVGKSGAEAEPMKAVEFKADHFSVYGVVGTGSITTTFLSADGKTYEVTVNCDTDANIPAGSELVVSEVEASADKYEDYLESAAEAMDISADKIAYAKLLDISIVKDGKEITPETPVDVQIKLLDRESFDENESLNVIHYESGDENPVLVDGSEQDGVVSFEAEGFSVYGVFYTVDFHWEVDGKEYEFSIPGGGFISIERLVEALGIGESDDFMADVESVEFSRPEVVWVGKVNEDTTVGGLKEANELEIEYSADLTEEQIADINENVIESGDWVLFSVQPFDTEETLTVTMKNGDRWTVKVTDDQISSFDNLSHNERYVLYIEDGGGNYYALDNAGNTVPVPDNDLDALSGDYLWRFTTQENGSSNYDNACTWLSGGNYLDVYWTDKEKPVVSATNSDNWVPIVTMVPHGDGFYFRDLNPDYRGQGDWGATYYQNRFLTDNYDSGSNTHNLQTVFGNVYYYDFWGNLHGNPNGGAATIHVYKQGSSYTVKAQSNNETFGHVRYTQGDTDQQTTASQTSISVLTENNVDKNKAVPGNFVAVPETGYKFTGWTVMHVNSWDEFDVTDWGGSGVTSESGTIKPTVNGDLILQANFEPEKVYTFTVTTNDENMGTVGGGNENGETLAGQVNFTSVSGVVIDDRGSNEYELTAVQKPLHKFVAWQLTDSSGEVVQTIETDTIPAHSIELTGENMTLTAVFRKKTDTEIDEGDIDTLLGSWKTDMTSDFVGVNKTAHVHDYDNRIYEIDLSASSGKWAVESSINLDFITDTSRSMYFPANLDYAINSYATDEENEEASSFSSLKDWLDDHGTVGEKYYVISNDDTSTMYAVHYSDGWKFRDASYYYYWTVDTARSSYAVPDGLTASGQPLNGKTLSGVIYKSRTAPTSYQTHGTPASLNEYWSRLDYLYKAVMTATETLKTIDPQAAVHLTTFNKASSNEGWLVESTAETLTEAQIYSSSLSTVVPTGGTRQDEGLYTSRTGENRGNNAGPGTTAGVGSTSAFYDSSHRHYAILVTDGAPNGAEWGNSNGSNANSIYGQAKRLKDITDDNGNPLTLMTLGLSLDFVSEGNRTNLAGISSDSSKYAKAANNGGQIVTAIEDLVTSMICKAAMFGTVSDTLDPAFYPVKADGTPIAPGYYNMQGGEYTPTEDDTNEYCRWTRNGDSWTVTYYNQTFKWPVRDENGNITRNGWDQAFYAKAKENFIGGNTIETNSVGTTTFTGSHTILLDKNGNERLDTKRKIVNHTGNESPITKNDIPTPHVNVKQLTLNENETEWKVYIQTEVEPLPQLKALYDNIKVLEVVDSSTDNMITDNADMLFVPGTGTVPETFLLSEALGKDSSQIDWSLLTGDPGFVEFPYTKYEHATGVIRLTLSKGEDSEAANYEKHNTSSNLVDVEEYILTAQFIPYTTDEMINSHGEETDAHDKQYHTTPQQSPGAEQLSGKPSVNKHIIDLFVRGLSITKANESFVQGLSGAEFEVYRPATAEEIAAGGDAIKTFEDDPGKYVWDRDLDFDNNGVAYVNGVRSFTPPRTTFYLVETKAPDGYELREEPIPAVLEITNEYIPLPAADGEDPVPQDTKPESGMYNWVEKARLTLVSDYGILRTTGAYDPTNSETIYTHDPEPTSEYEVMYYRISNNPGVELPSTGGPGTGKIYLFGIMLTGFAAAGLVMRKRRRAA